MLTDLHAHLLEGNEGCHQDTYPFPCPSNAKRATFCYEGAGVMMQILHTCVLRMTRGMQEEKILIRKKKRRMTGAVHDEKKKNCRRITSRTMLKPCKRRQIVY